MPDHAGMTAIVLAGGKSSRMGFDKALLPFRGKTLIENITAAIAPYFEEIIVMVNENGKTKGLDLQDSRIYEDVFKGNGPMGGIYSGLCYAAYSYSMVFTCDMPFVDSECILRLKAAAKTGDHEIICYKTEDGTQEPFPGVYSREVRCLMRLLIDQGQRSMRRLFDVCDIRWVSQGNILRDAFINLNQTDDYWKMMDAVKGGAV